MGRFVLASMQEMGNQSPPPAVPSRVKATVAYVPLIVSVAEPWAGSLAALYPVVPVAVMLYVEYVGPYAMIETPEKGRRGTAAVHEDRYSDWLVGAVE
jgi:hypothetical protein